MSNRRWHKQTSAESRRAIDDFACQGARLHHLGGQCHRAHGAVGDRGARRRYHQGGATNLQAHGCDPEQIGSVSIDLSPAFIKGVTGVCVMRSKVDALKEVPALVRRHLEGIVAWAQTRQTNGFLKASIACSRRPSGALEASPDYPPSRPVILPDCRPHQTDTAQ